MEFDEERLLSAHALSRSEDDGDLSLRPHTLEEYIGQDTVKENLKIFIEAAKKGRTPSTMFFFTGLLALEKLPSLI